MPMRSCGSRRRISPWRSSTADRSDGCRSSTTIETSMGSSRSAASSDRPGAEPPWVSDFTYCRDLDGLRIRGVRDRTTSPAASSAGERARKLPMRPSSSMPWRRPCTPVVPYSVQVSSITATAAVHICRSATPSALPRCGVVPSVGSVGDSYETPSPRRSTASTRPR